MVAKRRREKHIKEKLVNSIDISIKKIEININKIKVIKQ